MPKCPDCGRRFFFKRFIDGRCPDCARFASEQQRRTEILSELDQRIQNTSARCEELKRIASDQCPECEKYTAELKSKTDVLDELNRRIEESSTRLEKLEAAVRKSEKAKEAFKSIQYATEQFNSWAYRGEQLLENAGIDPESLSPIAPADLMCMQIKELRSRYKKNEKEIEKLLESYKSRYSTKANATIYQLMVLALEAEFRNILHGINYGKLDSAIEMVKNLTSKYYVISSNANQTIAPTMAKFIGQLEYYYIEAVKIEYEYYVKREQAKEEQRALREQMRQEAEERRILEQQRKQVEAEQLKYEKELARINEALSSAQDDAEISKLQSQIDKVQSQLDSVQDKKDEIIRLQNGKAGTVYVISNIGSFGDDVFKIGMTRRLEPMDRVKELGDASVPFPFDVHCFIFSEDAVALESKIHSILNDDRVNKVNLRKEFFHVTLDRIQEIVEECDPSAAFNRTALAEQYRQSLSIDHVADFASEDFDAEDEE